MDAKDRIGFDRVEYILNGSALKAINSFTVKYSEDTPFFEVRIIPDKPFHIDELKVNFYKDENKVFSLVNQFANLDVNEDSQLFLRCEELANKYSTNEALNEDFVKQLNELCNYYGKKLITDCCIWIKNTSELIEYSIKDNRLEGADDYD